MNAIRILKLFLISVVVFGILLFCLSLLFPSTTYVSRAVNVKKEKAKLAMKTFELNELAFRGKVSPGGQQYYPLDTVSKQSSYNPSIAEGVAVYELGKDSTAIQVYYEIYVPWYKPWKKFGLMLNETKYGPSLDSAISRISKKF